MEMNEYQNEATKTFQFNPDVIDPLVYAVLGLVGEAGEVADKLKKVYRNDEGRMTDDFKEDIRRELGDVLWYISQTARIMDISLDDIAQTNIEKLRDRQERNVIKSTGDNR